MKKAYLFMFLMAVTLAACMSEDEKIEVTRQVVATPSPVLPMQTVPPVLTETAVSIVSTPATAIPIPAPTLNPNPPYECPIEPVTGSSLPPISDNPVRVAFANPQGVQLWQSDSEAVETIFAADDVTALQMSDDGERIVFLRAVEADMADVWVIDSDGGNGRLLFSDADLRALHGEAEHFVVRPLHITWVPNSHTLAFSTIRYEIVDGYAEGITAHLYDDLNLLNVDNNQQTRLLPPGRAGDFHYSPDGKQIAIVNDTSLSLVDAGGQNLRSDVVTWKALGISHEYHRPNPVWAADSSYLLIASSNAADNIDAFYNPEASSTIWRVPTGGGSPEQLATMIGAPLYLIYSPDLTQVAFSQVTLEYPTQKLHIAAADNSWHIIERDEDVDSLSGLSDDSKFFFYGWQDGLQIDGLCQRPQWLSPPVGNWVDLSRYLFVTNFPPELYLGALDGRKLLIGNLWGSPYISVRGFLAYDFAVSSQ